MMRAATRLHPRSGPVALLSAMSLLGLQGPPEHGFDEDVWVETLVRALETPGRPEDEAAVAIDALGPHATHPRVMGAADVLLSVAESTSDPDLAGAALHLLAERGAPISSAQQDRLLRLVHPYWRCLGYVPRGASQTPSKVGCGAPEPITAPTPAGRVAGWAGWAAAKVGPDRLAVAKVLTLLLVSFDDFTRAAAVDGLTALGEVGRALVEDAITRTEAPGVQLRLTEAWARAVGRTEGAPRPSESMLHVLRGRARTARGHARRTYLRLLLHLDPNPHEVVAQMITDLRDGGDAFVLRDLATAGSTASAALPEVLAALDLGDSLYAACEALKHIVPEGERPRVAAFVAARLDGDRLYPLLRVLDTLGSPGARVLQASLRDGPVELRRTLAGMRPEAPKKGQAVRPSTFDTPAWQEALRARLREDPDPKVRAAAARHLGTPAACPDLLAQADRETEPEAFAGLAQALTGCGAPAVPHLLDWAHADDPVGSAARRALVPPTDGGARPPASVQDVLSILLGPADAEPRPRYRRPHRLDETGLAARLGAEAVPHLIVRLRAKAPEVRRDAAHVLGRIGAPARRAAPELAQALDDPDEDVRHWAAWSLGYLGDAGVASDLVSATTDPQSSVRRAAAGALGRVGAPVADLRLVLEARDATVVKEAAEALARADAVPGALFETLLALLDHKDADVSRHAARALAGMRHNSAQTRAGLRPLLTAGRARTRWAAAEALLRVGAPQDIVPALLVRREAPRAAQEEDAEAMRRLDRMLR